jgi:hypothetical protein
VQGFGDKPETQQDLKILFTFRSRGMDGYATYLLTMFGLPEPWSIEEVQVFVAKARAETKNPKHHIYHFS